MKSFKALTEKNKIRIAEAVILFAAILLAVMFYFLGNRGNFGSGDKIAEVSDLKGRDVVTVTGSIFADMIQKDFPDSEVIYVTGWSDQALSVSQHKATFFLSEESSLAEYLGAYDNLVLLPQAIGSITSSFATTHTPRGQDIMKKLDEYIDISRKDGTLDALYEKWTNPDTAPDHLDEIPIEGEDNGTINIIGCLDWYPFTYASGTEPCGYFLDVVNHFCAWAGYTPNYEFAEIDSALAGFESGRYDFFAYGMTFTDERAEIMYFSTPLFSEPVYPIINVDDYAYESSADKAKVSLFEKIYRSFEKTLITDERWKSIVKGLGVTIIVSILSALFGTLLGALLCYMRMSRNVFATAFARLFIRIEQGVPIVLLLLVLYYVILARLPISAFWVCIIGFSIDFASYVSEIFRSGIESISAGQSKAAKALGFTDIAGFVHIILPQALVVIIPVYSGQFVSLVKLTSVAGYISLQDLTKAADIVRSRTYEAFFPLILTAAIYFLLTLLMTYFLKKLLAGIRPKERNISYLESFNKNLTRDFDVMYPGESSLPKNSREEVLLRIEDVSKGYGDVHPLRSISCKIQKGDVISIIGPSGTGKSTLLNVINRLEEPDGGKIFFRDEDTTKKGYPLHLMRRKIGMVFQSFNLFEHLTVVENIMLAPVMLLKMDKEAAYCKAMELLHLVGLSDKALYYPSDLSGGQKQRIAIVRAMALEPEVILFDEPTSALDPTMVGEVLSVIRGLANRGMTMLIVTHEMKFARDVSNRVFYLDEGVIYEEGTPDRIFDNPAKEKTRKFIHRLKVFKAEIRKGGFDCIAMKSEFDRYTSENLIGRKLSNRTFSFIEELCFQMLLSQFKVDSTITLLTEYSEANNQLEFICRYGGEKLNPLDEGDEISAAILRHDAQSIRYEYENGTNVITATIK